jgi:hypothetical protein
MRPRSTNAISIWLSLTWLFIVASDGILNPVFRSIAPHTPITERICGERGQGEKVVNRAATAFRMAASTLRTSQSYLGAKFRRLRSRLGPPKAITAMARTLAILFYRMLKFGQDYLDRGTEFYEQRQRDQQLQYLQKKAAQLGFQVVALPPTPK